VDPAPADVRGPKAFRLIIAARRLDIVHHQVEGRGGTGRRRLLRLPNDNMRATAKLENREVVAGEYWAQANGFESPLGSGDIGCRKPDMAHRYRWPLIDSLRHNSPFCASAIQRVA